MFVCDNLAFSGDGGTVVLRKKHTSRLDLSESSPQPLMRIWRRPVSSSSTSNG